MLRCMPSSTGKVHVVRVKKSHVDKQGHRRDYQSVYLRRTYRDGPKVRNETVANLSALPQAAVAAVEATLKGQTLVAAGAAVPGHHPGRRFGRGRRVHRRDLRRDGLAGRPAGGDRKEARG